MSTIVRQGPLRGDKVRYNKGCGDVETWCCVWYPFGGAETDEEETGDCFDFHAGDIDDMIALLQKLKEMEVDDGEG